MIEKSRILSEFKKYTDAYDPSDPKIRLKIEHTYEVAKMCEDIAKSLSLSEEDCLIAWTCGMLHDIGRFEQVKQYGTFFDSLSVDHAAFGADILFKDNLYTLFVPGKVKDGLPDTMKKDGCAAKTGELGACDAAVCEVGVNSADTYMIIRNLIEKAIRVHNAFRLPEDMTDREYLFATILRDADKIDILRVNCETPFEEVYNVPLDELKAAEVSEDTKQAFREKRCAKRHDRTTAIDYLVGHICLTFELVHDRSKELVKEQGYLYELLDFKSNNPNTAAWFEYMKGEIQ